MILLLLIPVAVLAAFAVVAYFVGYDQREKPIHAYIRGPVPYYPDSLRRFLDRAEDLDGGKER